MPGTTSPSDEGTLRIGRWDRLMKPDLLANEVGRCSREAGCESGTRSSLACDSVCRLNDSCFDLRDSNDSAPIVRKLWLCVASCVATRPSSSAFHRRRSSSMESSRESGPGDR